MEGFDIDIKPPDITDVYSILLKQLLNPPF